MIIDNIYILETKRILDNFNYIFNEITKYEDILLEKKGKMLDIQKQLSVVQSTDKNDLYKEQEIYKLIDQYNSEIIKIEKSVKPLMEKIEVTKKEIAILYDVIMEKYSDYSEEEIRQQIHTQLTQNADS